MTYLICLFFPAFISLRKFVSNDDNCLSIIMKYVYINIVVNFFSFFVVWLITNSRSIIDISIMTIPFFIKYLFISSIFSLLLPRLYNELKNNFKIEVKRK